VGGALLAQTLEACGLGTIVQVAEQQHPDPDFPTVAFPNPEEPGALDLLVALAEAEGASLAIANDPDADRLAIAAAGADGAWSALTGDQTGAVLADHLLRRLSGEGDLLFATTVVSSRLLGAMARAVGAHHVETLTGFKWLCRPALENPGLRQVLIYEEALGYAIGPTTRDKDGITAAVVAVDMANRLASEGRSVWDVLDDLARKHGAHVTANGSIRLEGLDWREQLNATAERISSEPPTTIIGLDVVRTDQPAADVIRLWLEDNTRVVLRPSGTEPKFKYYCEAIEPVSTTPQEARDTASERLGRLTAELSSTVLRAPQP
jgi:phosphomannomutase